MMVPLTSTVPFMALPGNHEVEYDGRDASKVMVHYSKRFRFPGSYAHASAAAAVGRGTLPGQQSGYHYAWDIEYEGGSSYYSFDAGLVHFLSLNTYNTHSSGPGSPMYDFADEDLASVDRRKTPWVLVGMHAPFYNSNTAHRPEEEAATALLKAHFEPLFVKHKVNFVFAGHVHAYERTHAVASGTRSANGAGPVYVNVGDGGNYEKLAETWMDPQPDWSAVRDADYYGYGLFRVFNASCAEWDWRPNPEGSERRPGGGNFNNGTSVDRFLVSRNYAVPPGGALGNPTAMALGVLATCIAIASISAVYYFFLRHRHAVFARNGTDASGSFTRLP